MNDRTILDLYRHELEEPRADHYVHAWPGGRRAFGTLEFLGRTAALADSLERLGVGAGDRVMVLCETRPEWHMVDLATLDLGAVNAPVYGTLTSDQVGYQVQDSGAKLVVAEDGGQMAKLLEVRSGCPKLQHLVQLDGQRESGVLGLEPLMTPAGGAAEDRFWERAGRITPDDLATIVYTSGTTGEPKGVMLTHRNIVTNVREAHERVDVAPTELGLEFLPLCHMIERIAGYLYMAVGASRVYCSVSHVAELLREIRPAAFACVPRVLEKVHAAVMAKANAASPARYEQVRKFAVLREPLTIEGGELTPTLKVRRRAVAERHRELIDGLYG